MPNKTKNPDLPDKDTQTHREKTQDDRMPQRRDGGLREDQEPIEPDRANTQKVDREPDSRTDEQRDEEDDLEDEADRGLIE